MSIENARPVAMGTDPDQLSDNYLDVYNQVLDLALAFAKIKPNIRDYTDRTTFNDDLEVWEDRVDFVRTLADFMQEEAETFFDHNS